MADFFSDLFDSFTNQQATPQQTIIPTSDLLGQSYGTLNSQIAPGILGFNRALAPGLTDIQLGVERQYDPNIATLRGATTKSILDELNLGGTLGPELQEQVVRNALEGASASGFGSPVGLSAGGRGLVARDLGLTSLDLAKSRRGEALGAVRSSPGLNELFNTGAFSGMGADLAAGVGADIRGVQAAQDEYANLVEDTRRKNFSALLNTGGRIAGMVIGGIAGSGNPQAIQAGGNIGGSLGGQTGVAGYGQKQGGGSRNPFTSLLSEIGGPQWGIGSQSGGKISAGLGGGIYS